MITEIQIQRAKQKAAKLQEDKLDAPIIEAIVAIDDSFNRENAALEEINQKKILKEKEIQKIEEIKNNIVDEAGFRAAQNFLKSRSMVKTFFALATTKHWLFIGILISCLIFILLCFLVEPCEERGLGQAIMFTLSMCFLAGFGNEANRERGV